MYFKSDTLVLFVITIETIPLYAGGHNCISTQFLFLHFMFLNTTMPSELSNLKEGHCGLLYAYFGFCECCFGREVKINTTMSKRRKSAPLIDSDSDESDSGGDIEEARDIFSLIRTIVVLFCINDTAN